MENTSKALLIAAAVLIVIILITSGMKILNPVDETTEMTAKVGESLSEKGSSAVSHIVGDRGLPNEPDTPEIGETGERVYIPEGAKYTTYTTEGEELVLESKKDDLKEFPKNVQNGDIYIYNDYEYRYNMTMGDDMDSWVSKPSQSGWGIRVIETSKKEYSNIPTIINGKNVTDMNATFYGCDKMITPPIVPDTVTNMYLTFAGCTSLKTAPVIPNKVTNMVGTFALCESLVAAPTIPISVTNMYATFAGCTSLKTAPVIPEKVDMMNLTFSGCTSLTTAPNIPSSVVFMEEIFRDCENLTGIIMINANSLLEHQYRYCFEGTVREIILKGEDINMLNEMANTSSNGNVKVGS